MSNTLENGELSAQHSAIRISINFYHLTTSSLEVALPKILERGFSAGYKTLVVAESDARIEQLNSYLWTYNPDSFLPHGSVNDAKSEMQPILLSTTAELLNSAKLLVVTDGREITNEMAGIEKILDIFDGKDKSETEKARVRWKKYKDSGYEMTYFKQNERGGWDKKA